MNIQNLCESAKVFLYGFCEAEYFTSRFFSVKAGIKLYEAIDYCTALQC